MMVERGGKAVVVILLALTCLLGCFPMADFDIWWHLGTGRIIGESGAIPRVDTLTYTNAGRVWIDLYWFFQLVVTGLYRLGGPTALVFMKAVLGVVVVALALLARRPGGKAWPLTLVWLPALVVLSGRLCERPELFSLVYLGIFLAVLGRAHERPRWLWALPVAQLAWVNSHGFFVLGLFVLGAVGVDLIVERRWPRPRPVPTIPLRPFLMAAGATLLACFVNPYGARVFQLPFEQFQKLGDHGLYRANVGELRSIVDFMGLSGINNPYLLGFFGLAALGLASFGLAWRKGRPPMFRIILFLAALDLGWQATRNSALFAVITAVVSLWNLDEAFPVATAKPDGAAAKRGKAKAVRSRFAVGSVLAFVALAGLVLSGSLYTWAGEGRTIGLGEKARWYAHDACAFLSRPDMPARIVAFNLGQAGVCVHHVSPTKKLFIDPRLEVNTADTFQRYVTSIRKLWRGESEWEGPLGIDYGKPGEVPAILIERGILDRAIAVLSRDPRWAQVHADNVAVVFALAGSGK